MNKKELKEAARKLCELSGVYPDELVTYANGTLLNPPQTREELAQKEIEKYLKVRQAVYEVEKPWQI